MKRKPLTSRMLRTVGYDAATRTLEVEFHDGAIYKYFDVPQEIYRNLLHVDSHSRYFLTHIRERFAFERANPDLKYA